MKLNNTTFHKITKMSLVWLLLPIALIMVFVAGRVGVTRSSFIDTETSNGNVFQAWYSDLWTQTSEAEFESGIICQVDTTGHIDEVWLAQVESVYYSSGNVTSIVLDTGMAGAVWNVLSWSETLPAGTDITFEVRASNAIFLKDAGDPAWTYAGGVYPVIAGLPIGRYLQWRATLTTSDTSSSPVLHEVRVYYY